jgi:ribose transport system substrate-binding protein
MIDRKGGFQERIAQMSAAKEEGKSAPQYAVVGYYEDLGNPAVCEENIKQILSENPDLACFVGMNAQHGPILLRVLKDSNKLGQIKLITFDTESETLDGIEQGHIYATLAQDPFTCGFRAVRLLNVLVGGDPFEVPIVGTGANSTGFDVVDKENLATFRAALEKQQQAAQDHEKSNAKPAKSA